MISTCIPDSLLKRLAAYDEQHSEPRFQTRDYHEVNVGTAASVQACVGKYNCKGEDRFILWTRRRQETINSGDKQGSKVRQRPSKASRCRSLSGTSSTTSNDVSFPILLAFAGVFDGHDGPKAAEYCATGLLPHVLLELQKLASPKKRRSADTTKMSSSTLPDASTAVLLEQTYVNAFHHAHKRFGSSMEPPSIDDDDDDDNIPIMGKQSSWRSSLALRRKLVHRSAQIFGGTTACTLSLHQTQNGDLLAVVANCGDSRLLTDDGSGVFRQVTRDHRLQDPKERQRLDVLVRHGQASVGYNNDGGGAQQQQEQVLRLYPGGLAVSRTIGDVDLCKGAIPTPDVYRIPLWQSRLYTTDSTREVTESGPEQEDDDIDNNDAIHETRTIRFVLGSDGLWDVMGNEDVGSLASRQDPQGKSDSPASAVDAVMKECLLRTGGHHDDTTVLVVDVKLPRL